ncbi:MULTISPECIES: ROK family glucokinase [Microbispora]|uniref:Glucokinase n=3 Tax=Microbispora TaxID=2005 RepID=A0ABY3LY42_9ACTN|nr:MULTISPECIES: ROK family glucokinase [Microbispora]RGA01748.1 ROK family protein [Microbispora triticiradicis]TLP53192.1 ROK family glucokinase [Microbispora fusca]TYB59346.1 ROK family glucokinase [Microbispora tritici]GLW21134.1 glucokinase [Microbispora amethystogenes]
MALTIGVDVGGTKIAFGVVDENGGILERGLRHSPAGDPEKMALTIADVVNELAARHEVEAVGIGAAGFVDETRSVIRFAPNLAWREEPLRKKVGELVGLPVVVENDANAMAWGEYRFGAGRGESHVVCVTVGTGIGGGIVLGGDLYRGRWGMGAELGHMQTVPGGRPCGCGNNGCWERYASGSSLLAEAKANAEADPAAATHLLRLGGSVEGVRGEHVTEAARLGDRAALDAFESLADWLAQGLADLAAILDPGCFILGGGVSGAADLFADRVRDEFAARLTGRGHRPLADIRVAEMGPSAGLVGAGDLARLR